MSKNDSLNGTTLPLRKIRQRESAVPKHRYGRYQIADIINLYNESKAFIYEDHVLFNKNKTTLIAYIAREKNYTIPNSVTTIGEGAFKGCHFLTSIKIPNSVTTIGEGAFNGCYSLTSINIPNSVTTIGKLAFNGCYSLTSINIPNSVTTIENRAFH